jgi:ATP adenylyltransferase
MEYIQANKDSVSDGCVFCALLAGEGSEDERILRRGERAFVTLAKFPYNPGHLLVLPTRHVGELEELTPGRTPMSRRCCNVPWVRSAGRPTRTGSTSV